MALPPGTELNDCYEGNSSLQSQKKLHLGCQGSECTSRS